jgi:hypothetical protein
VEVDYIHRGKEYVINIYLDTYTNFKMMLLFIFVSEGFDASLPQCMSMKLINSNLIFSNKIVLVISKEVYFSRSLHTLVNVFLESKLRI